MQAPCIPNMKVSTQILRPVNFVHLANLRQVVCYITPPTPTQGGSSSSTLVTTTSLKGYKTGAAQAPADSRNLTYTATRY